MAVEKPATKRRVNTIGVLDWLAVCKNKNDHVCWVQSFRLVFRQSITINWSCESCIYRVEKPISQVMFQSLLNVFDNNVILFLTFRLLYNFCPCYDSILIVIFVKFHHDDAMSWKCFLHFNPMPREATSNPWWRHQMETFSASLAICVGNSPGPGEFPTQRPVTRSFDVYFDLRPNKWLSKQSWGWWFETLSCSLWRHRNAMVSLSQGPVRQSVDVWFVRLNKLLNRKSTCLVTLFCFYWEAKGNFYGVWRAESKGTILSNLHCE